MGLIKPMKTGGVTKVQNKVSKTIGWMNKNSLMSPINYAEVVNALGAIDENQACRLLNELDEKAYSISNPTGWLQKAAARIASGEENPSQSSGAGSKWSSGGGGGAWLDLRSALSMWGKGGGKGGKNNDAKRQTMMKLKEIDTDCTVWIGGLPNGLTWKDLEKHMESTATKLVISELLAKGSGVCAFKTAEEATAVIAAANGSELKGKTLEVDVWTKKETVEKN